MIATLTDLLVGSFDTVDTVDTQGARNPLPAESIPTKRCPPVLWRVVGCRSEVFGGMAPTPPGPAAITPEAAAKAWATRVGILGPAQVLCRHVDDRDGLGPRVDVEVTPETVYATRVLPVDMEPGGSRALPGLGGDLQ